MPVWKFLKGAFCVGLCVSALVFVVSFVASLARAVSDEEPRKAKAAAPVREVPAPLPGVAHDPAEVKEAVKEVGLTRTFREDLTAAVARAAGRALRRGGGDAGRGGRALDGGGRGLAPEAARYVSRGGSEARSVAEDLAELTARRVDDRGLAVARKY